MCSRFFKQAPCIISVYLNKNESFSYLKDLQAIGAAIQNILLTAYSLGIASCWVGEILKNKDEIAKIHNVSSEFELMGIVILGYEEKGIPIYKQSTNDLGFFDKKNNLIVIGRSDELIIVNSHNIYPSVIENMISNISGIVECKVVKIDINRAITCCAYCGPIDESTLYRNLQNELLPYELPQCFIKFDKLPRNINQKIDVNLLIEMCRSKYEKTNNLY